jgi:hypothetical protein
MISMVNIALTERERAAARAPGPAPLLDGVQRADWTTRPDAARRIGAALADRGEVAYCDGNAEAAVRLARRAPVAPLQRVFTALQGVPPIGAALRRRLQAGLATAALFS